MPAAPGPEVRVVPGRDLRESPRWPESPDVLFFDVTSGDFWVLGEDAARLLRQVLHGEPAADAASATVDGLIAAGLLERHPEAEA